MDKILVIEDDKGISELERDYLEASAFEVEIAEDGKKGLELSLQNDYKAIVLDIMLPGMDGFNVCREIRKQKETPILMVSAKQEDIDKIRGLGLGADDFLVKPFSPAELVARVKAHISRFERISKLGVQDTKEAQTILAGKMVIQLSSHQVFIDDQEVLLTPYEYQILTLLALNIGIVFTKDQLFEKVWGVEAMGETSTIMVHINRMRDKIKKISPLDDYIDTVWGVGYRFHQWENYKKS